MSKIKLPDGGTPEKCHEVYALARELLDIHGLHSWRVEWDRSHKRAGQCRRGTKVIGLSAPLMSIWRIEDARDTILHEIAHALTHGAHNAAWRVMCMQIGADPTRCWGNNGEARIPGKWQGKCPNGHVISRDRETRKMHRLSCGVCSPRYNPQLKYAWTKTR